MLKLQKGWLSATKKKGSVMTFTWIKNAGHPNAHMRTSLILIQRNLSYWDIGLGAFPVIESLPAVISTAGTGITAGSINIAICLCPAALGTCIMLIRGRWPCGDQDLVDALPDRKINNPPQLTLNLYNSTTPLSLWDPDRVSSEERYVLRLGIKFANDQILITVISYSLPLN